MTTTIIVPTNVRDMVGYTGPAATLTGSPDTMWGDGSDTTYAYRAQSEPTNGIILADVAAGQVTGTIMSATATMRVLLDTGNSDQRVDFWLDTLGSESPAGTGFAFSGADTLGTDPSATPGTTTTLTSLVLMSNSTGVPMTGTALTSAFAAGFTVGVSRRAAVGTAALTVYELTFTVTTATTALYPLRRYPPVNNGGSGPTRHYPRAVNRRAGGTY